jgi:hypothetical protein
MPAINAPQSRLPGSGHGFGGTKKVSYGFVDFTGTITTADSANVCQLPVGAIVLAVLLEADDLDTGGSPTLTLNVGDAASANRYFAASTVAQTGVTAVATAATGLFYTVTGTNDTMVRVAVQANAATSAAGTVRIAVEYVLPQA